MLSTNNAELVYERLSFKAVTVVDATSCRRDCPARQSINARCATIPHVKRIVLFLLMVVLQSQLSWAAELTYAHHGSGAPAQKSEHQRFECEADVAFDGTVIVEETASLPSEPSGECDHCHSHGATAMPSARLMPSNHAVHAAALGLVTSGPEVDQARPERPRWTPLA